MKTLVVAAISGEIYLANIKKDGTMSDSGRVEMTSDVLRATNEWFMANRKKGYKNKIADGKYAHVFHTVDEEKAERILAILREEDTQ